MDRIKWDKSKNIIVKKKHGISFLEIISIFNNPSTTMGGDLISENPDQFVIIGFSANGILVTVVYEFRIDKHGEYIWIVTLWKTTKSEKRKFKI